MVAASRLEGEEPDLPGAQRSAGQHGVDRYAKYKALARLEKAGLITVDRRDRKTPIVTLVGL